MAENSEKKKSRASREKLLALAREHYPERKFRDLDTPEVEGEEGVDDLDDAISEYVEELQSGKAAYDEKNGKLRALLLNDPYVADVMQDWIETGDPRAALVKTFGDDLGMSDEAKETFKGELAGWRERKAASDEADKVAKENYLQSLASLKEWGDAKGLTLEQQRDIMVKLLTIAINGFCEEKYSVEDFEMVNNAINHNADVEAARQEGEVKGRNEKIAAQRKTAGKAAGMIPTAVGLGGGRTAEPRPAAPASNSPWAGIR